MKSQARSPRRSAGALGLAFLDVISCGFGAIVLLLLISRPGHDVDAVGPATGTLLQRTFATEDEIRELDDLLRREYLKLADQQGSNETARIAAERKETAAERARIEKEKRTAVFAMTQGEASERDDEVGGIPVDSDYVVFVIDNSGSMRSIWPRVVSQVTAILDIHPEVTGFQVLNDNGVHLLRNRAGRWLPDQPLYRNLAIGALERWRGAMSNSSPVEGVESALRLYAGSGTMAIYVFGDDYSGDSYDDAVAEISTHNRDRQGNLRARIHGIGFLSERPNRFSILMREVARRNNGAFIALYP